MIAEPVILLSPPLSAASRVAAMLGQHPELYAVPETHLFAAEMLQEWLDLCAASTFAMAHGLLRAVAELELGGQTEANVELAGGWLRRRRCFTTGYLLELLAARVHPKTIVERSASLVFDLTAMERASRMFPEARFIHLVQHPLGYAAAVRDAVEELTEADGRCPLWLEWLAPASDRDAGAHALGPAALEPLHAWHALHRNIGAFLESVPAARQIRVCSEDVVSGPMTGLRVIAEWLGLRTDDEAIEAASHPERSAYSCFGPAGARYGDNPVFLANPTPPPMGGSESDGPSSGPLLDRELAPEVKDLAARFGYA